MKKNKKFKKLITFLLEAGAIAASALFAKTLYRAKQFKVSCDINVDAMDSIAVLTSKFVEFNNRPMNDFKLGSFLAFLTCDMCNLEYTKRQYDMTVVADQGIVTIIIPEDIGLLVASSQNSLHNVVDQRLCIPKDPKSFIAINADLRLGLLIIKNKPV